MSVYTNVEKTLYAIKQNLTMELENTLLLVLKFTIIDKYEIPSQEQITALEKLNSFYNIFIFLLKLENAPKNSVGFLIEALIYILDKSDKLLCLNTSFKLLNDSQLEFIFSQINNKEFLVIDSFNVITTSKQVNQPYKLKYIHNNVNNLNKEQYIKLTSYTNKLFKAGFSREKLTTLITHLENSTLLNKIVNDEIRENNLSRLPAIISTAPLDTLTRHLLDKSAIGNDSTLETAHYWYSIRDGIALLLFIRSTKLNYQLSPPGNNQEELVLEEEPEYSKTSKEEYYNSYHENQQHTFLADPYITQNFNISFPDDVNTITGRHEGKLTGRNHLWQQMPTLLILPILTGCHWRAIRIEIDYHNNSASILWDDPYGKDNFSKELKEYFKNIIHQQLLKLFRTQMKIEGSEQKKRSQFKLLDITIFEFEKLIQQQRKGNSWDCGPIIFSKITDYIQNIRNSIFAEDITGQYYTIKQANSEQISNIRHRHRANYTELTIDKKTNFSVNKKTKELKNAYEQNLAIKFAIASSPTMSKIQDDVSNWPTEQCNEFLNQLELLQAIRLNQNEKSHIDGYTNDELTNAYKFIKQKYKYQQAKRELQTLIKANTFLSTKHYI